MTAEEYRDTLNLAAYGRAVGLREMYLTGDEVRELEDLLTNPVAQPKYAPLRLATAGKGSLRESHDNY